MHLAKRFHLESRIETCPGDKKSAGGSVSASSADARKKGAMGLVLLMCHSPQPPHHPHLWFNRLVCFPFLDEWRSITSNRFVLNLVQGHHLQLRSHPPLFRNFWQLHMKVAAGHHPIIQKEVDKLLAKGAVEPSSGCAGF